MVDGVVSARITPAPGGRGKPSLRLIARAERPLAGVLHDVTSTLRERFDLDLDQADVQVAVVAPETGSTPAGPRWRLVSVAERASGEWVDVAAQVSQGDRLCSGYARVRARTRARRRAAALAVIDAVRVLLGVDLALELVGVEDTRFVDRSAVVVALALNDARRTERFTGLAERAGQRDDECVARATLDALNRRLRLVAVGTRQQRGKEDSQDLEMALAAGGEQPRLVVIESSGRRSRGANEGASRERRPGKRAARTQGPRHLRLVFSTR